MIIVIKLKDTDNIIGAKEEIAMRLEGIADILRIDIIDDTNDEVKSNRDQVKGEEQWKKRQ